MMNNVTWISLMGNESLIQTSTDRPGRSACLRTVYRTGGDLEKQQRKNWGRRWLTQREEILRAADLNKKGGEIRARSSRKWGGDHYATLE